MSLRTSIFAVLCLAGWHSFGQKITFKLTYQDQQYVGKMKPKWFDEVAIKPSGQLRTDLAGASGFMSGTRFGEMDFTIAENILGTFEPWMIKTNNGWYPIEKYSFKGDRLKLRFDWGFRPKPQDSDLAILRRVDQMLTDKSRWHNRDDRKCDDDFDNQIFSLYCALRQASEYELGDFNHRNAALNEIRRTIGAVRPKRKYEHRLMEFNNEESFQEIKRLISISIGNMERELR